MNRLSRLPAYLCAVSLMLAGCSIAPTNQNPHAGDELKLPVLDINRYMGRWYNIANVPYFGERGYVASYSEWHLQPEGVIQDIYVGQKGGFDAPETRREFSDSIVPNSGNAEWHVRLFGPVYVSQITTYVDPDYRYTILGTTDRNLVWIFARDRDISAAAYADLVARASAQGFNTAHLKRVPQHPEQIGKPEFQSPGDPD